MNSRISKWTKPENFKKKIKVSLKSWRLNNSIVGELAINMTVTLIKKKWNQI